MQMYIVFLALLVHMQNNKVVLEKRPVLDVDLISFDF